MTALRGTVEVTFTVSHRVALSRATDGWTDDERAALRRGDSDAREALIDAVWMDGKQGGFDDVDEAVMDLRIDEGTR